MNTPSYTLNEAMEIAMLAAHSKHRDFQDRKSTRLNSSH